MKISEAPPPLDDNTFGKMSMRLTKIPIYLFIIFFLIAKKKYVKYLWRNMWNIWRNMWEICRNMWRIWRIVWKIWRNYSHFFLFLHVSFIFLHIYFTFLGLRKIPNFPLDPGTWKNFDRSVRAAPSNAGRRRSTKQSEMWGKDIKNDLHFLAWPINCLKIWRNMWKIWRNMNKYVEIFKNHFRCRNSGVPFMPYFELCMRASALVLVVVCTSMITISATRVQPLCFEWRIIDLFLSNYSKNNFLSCELTWVYILLGYLSSAPIGFKKKKITVK